MPSGVPLSCLLELLPLPGTAGDDGSETSDLSFLIWEVPAFRGLNPCRRPSMSAEGIDRCSGKKLQLVSVMPWHG